MRYIIDTFYHFILIDYTYTKPLWLLQCNMESGSVVKMDCVSMYVYEVDRINGVLADIDDADILSYISILLLRWSRHNVEVYYNTQKRILKPFKNKHYYAGKKFSRQ